MVNIYHEDGTASSQKTEHYRLNRWTAMDKPQMYDFNYDNEVIDEALHQISEFLTNDNIVYKAGFSGNISCDKDSTGRIFLRGSVSNTTAFGVNTDMFILPEDMWPRYTTMAPCVFVTTGGGTYAAGFIYVYRNGVVRASIASGITVNAVYLDGINFIAA